MTTPRGTTDPRVIALSGASGGLGRALAVQLARPGRMILLCGRDQARLQALADAVRALGAEAEILCADIRDEEFAQRLRSFDDAHGIDLLIANAGVKAGNRDGSEPAGQAGRVIAVNLTGCIAMSEAVLPGMIGRGRGQVALVSSLAALSPSGDLLSYSASKAGVVAYATALRRAVAGKGISVSLILPGFVATAMTERHEGPTPFVLSAEAAARRIVAGLERRKAVIAFPRRLVWLTRLTESLPMPLSDRLISSARARILPDRDEREGRS